MLSTQSNKNIIGNYKVVSPVPHKTFHDLYIVYKISSPNQPLYILKLYKNQEGYIQQKYVFQAFPLFYSNYLIETSDNTHLNENHIQYSVTNYSRSGSLYDLVLSIGHFPLPAVKFYMHSLFSKLKQIHNGKKISFRTLHASDIIFSELKQIFIVGWSKMGEQITQSKLIYDCSQLMYFMITNGAFQEKGLGYKNNQKNRFLKQQFWDTSKKTAYSRFFPTDQNQFNNLVTFMKKITVESQVQKQTLESLTADEFFKELPTFNVVSQTLIKKELQKRSKQKQKKLKDFELKRKIAKIKKLAQQQQTRSFQEQQIVYGIIQFDIYNQKEQQGKNLSQSHFKEDLLKKIYSFFETKLDKCLNNDLLFEQNWIVLTQFQIKTQKLNENSLIFQLICYIKIRQSEDLIPSHENINFVLFIELAEPKKGQSCIKGYKIAVEQSINQILLSKFQKYITEDIIELFQYKCT